MKKLLLASTALVLSAGVAAAEVRVTGDARMGLLYNGNDVVLTSRARVTFTMSGETDSGLAFGASFRADQAAAANGDAAMTGGSVFISGEFGRLSMGDVPGAARAAVGDLYGVGLTGLGFLNDMTYIDRLTAGGTRWSSFDRRTAALYQYTIDDFTIYASVAQNNVFRTVGAVPPAAPGLSNVLVQGPAVALAAGQTYRERQWAVGAKYSFDGLTVSIGHENYRSNHGGVAGSVSATHTIGAVEYQMDGIKVKAIYGRAGGTLGTALAAEPNAQRNQYGLSISGTFDDVTVTAFANRNFFSTDYGIGMSYDLGGGASVVGGIAQRGRTGAVALGAPFAGLTRLQSTTTADIGLNFSF